MAIQLVAIDFGTTYSGYAFSVTHHGSKLKDVEMLANQVWYSGSSEVASVKTPTSLLLTREKKIVAFGYDAEEQYADIVLDGKADHHFFFHRFKMELHNNKNISSSMLLHDVRGETLPAIEVFELSIKALKEHLKTSVEIKNISLDPEITRWVLTVPAIWTDRAKQFMRESAELAGIPRKMLKIALEPEAASIYCQTYPSPGSKDIMKTGSKYVVADLGGISHQDTCNSTHSQDSITSDQMFTAVPISPVPALNGLPTCQTVGDFPSSVESIWIRRLEQVHRRNECYCSCQPTCTCTCTCTKNRLALSNHQNPVMCFIC